MLRIPLEEARVRVRTRFWGEGSVLAETVKTSCQGVETTLEIKSPASADKIAKLTRLAEAGCYVIHSLRQPTPVHYQVVLNGQPFDPRA